MRRGIGVLVTLLAVGACKPVTSVVPDRDFTLAVGREARIDGSDIRLRFDGVAGDSRCPRDVTCVTAGNAEVRLAAVDVSGEKTLVLNTNEGPRTASLAQYEISLEGLAPEPLSTRPMRAQDYRARLRLTLAPE